MASTRPGTHWGQWVALQALCWVVAFAVCAATAVGIILATWAATVPFASRLADRPTPAAPTFGTLPSRDATVVRRAVAMPGCSDATLVLWKTAGGEDVLVAAVDCANADSATAWATYFKESSSDAARLSRALSTDWAPSVIYWTSGPWVGTTWGSATALDATRGQVRDLAKAAPTSPRSQVFSPPIEGVEAAILALAVIGYVVARLRRERLSSPTDLTVYHDVTNQVGKHNGGWPALLFRVLFFGVLGLAFSTLLQALQPEQLWFIRVLYLILFVMFLIPLARAMATLPTLGKHSGSRAKSTRIRSILGSALMRMSSVVPIFAMLLMLISARGYPDALWAAAIIDAWNRGPLEMSRFAATPFGFWWSVQPWILLLFVVAVVVVFALITRWGRRLARPSGADLAADTPRVLYLRSFDDDSERIRSSFFAASPGELLAASFTRTPFVTFLSDLIGHFAQLVLIDPPDRTAVQSGAGLRYDDDSWRDGVKEHAAASVFVTMLVNASKVNEGFRWELDYVGNTLPHGRIMLVIAPVRREGFAERWRALVESLADSPRFANLSGLGDLPDGTHLLVRRAGGEWAAYGARWRSDRTYVQCYAEAVAENWLTWAQEAGVPESAARVALAKLKGEGPLPVLLAKGLPFNLGQRIKATRTDSPVPPVDERHRRPLDAETVARREACELFDKANETDASAAELGPMLQEALRVARTLVEAQPRDPTLLADLGYALGAASRKVPRGSAPWRSLLSECISVIRRIPASKATDPTTRNLATALANLAAETTEDRAHARALAHEASMLFVGLARSKPTDEARASDAKWSLDLEAGLWPDGSPERDGVLRQRTLLDEPRAPMRD